MRIGLISDTHIREASQNLPSKVEKIFRNVDLILHAGDIYNPSVLDELERIAPVLAVAGDDDYGAILTDRRVKLRHIFHFEDKVVWLIHDSAYYYSCTSWRATKNACRKSSEIPDIVLFGHTHYAILESHSGILFINPGSAMSVRNCSVIGSVALLNVESGKVDVNLVHL
jgi:putative phosphoesterase